MARKSEETENLLGVILDEQLKYHEHVKYVENARDEPFLCRPKMKGKTHQIFACVSSLGLLNRLISSMNLKVIGFRLLLYTLH